MATALPAVAVLFCLFSCGGDKKSLGEAVTSRDSTSVMTTRGIESLVSEEGIIKYRIVAEEWAWFDKHKPPYQAFEKGAYLEVYDSTLEVTSSVRADTAYYYDDKEEWELRGNVHAESVNGEKFDTELLYWNQRQEQVFSHMPIRIQQEDQIILGKGFRSNQDFTNYTINETQGIFPVQEQEETGVEPSDSTGNAELSDMELIGG